MTASPNEWPPGDPWERSIGAAQVRRWRRLRSLLLLATIALVLASILGLPEIVRGALTLAFVVVCPGMAVVLLIRLDDAIAEFMLGLAVSLALVGIIPGVFLYLGAWSPEWSLAVLVIITWVALGVDLVRARGEVPRVARQRLRREFQARPMQPAAATREAERVRVRALTLAGVSPDARPSLDHRNARLRGTFVVRTGTAESAEPGAAAPAPALEPKTRPRSRRPKAETLARPEERATEPVPKPERKARKPAARATAPLATPEREPRQPAAPAIDPLPTPEREPRQPAARKPAARKPAARATAPLATPERKPRQPAAPAIDPLPTPEREPRQPAAPATAPPPTPERKPRKVADRRRPKT